MLDLTLAGPEGRLEARYRNNEDDHSPIVLVLHPNPEQGGTMNNKVVYTLFHTFARQGFRTLRFNFRGVGKSQGSHDKGEGELADAMSALDWLQDHNPHASEIWVAGFSFGAWIAMHLLMRRPEIKNFVAISPPANMYDFAFLAPCPSSGLIVQGTNDAIVPQESVDELMNTLAQQRGIEVMYQVVQGADHFFGKQLNHLSMLVDDYIIRTVGQL